MNNLINAYFITDHAGDPIVPAPLMPSGMTKEEGETAIAKCGQFQGTPLEKLVEIAARSCYDSAGRGRSSPNMHKHILEVGHLSVLEHAVFTVDIPLKHGGGPPDLHGLVSCFVNKPSLFVRSGPGGASVRATLNLRHVMEWSTEGGDVAATVFNRLALVPALRKSGHRLAPQIVPKDDTEKCLLCRAVPCLLCRVVPPETPEEKWVTLLLTGSRGFSHELVRHGDWTAISQRSTRYVDESTSPWVEHPLEGAFMEVVRQGDVSYCGPLGPNVCMNQMKALYVQTVNALEPWLISKGSDKFTARKQARGAARGYLGNALYTEVVFSASVAQWLRMLKMRACGAADAEIREVFCKALPILQATRYGSAFAHLELVPSPDGIGQVCVEKAKAGA